MSEVVTIASRFRGPPTTGNGGYSCGVVGKLIDGPAEVTLRSPPPLDRPLTVVRAGAAVRILDGEQVVAEAKPAEVTITPPSPPSFEQAAAATRNYVARENHVFPSCFVCGPHRTPGDGLCIYPGAVEDRKIVAAPFVPDESLVDQDGLVLPEIVWATLDCPSWFGYCSFHEYNYAEGLILLGRLAANIKRRPRLGDRCIAVGWFVERSGRKILCGSALYLESGELLASAQATWISLAASAA